MRIINELVRKRDLYLLALPGIIFLIIFAYLPISGHLIAFKEYDFRLGILGSPWEGFKNFEFFFLGDDWIRITFNTIFINFLFIVFSFGTAITLALFLNEFRNNSIKRVYQSIILLPFFVSWVAVYLMLYAFLNKSEGILNNLLMRIGIEEIAWFSIPEYWPTILTIVHMWKYSGYLSVIFLAAITGISDEYYESARIDGATRVQQIRYVTLPLIRVTIIVMILLQLGRIFYGNFAMIYGIVGDNSVLFSTTDVIDTYVYRALKTMGNFSTASCVALYQSVAGLAVIILANLVVKKIDPESRLF